MSFYSGAVHSAVIKTVNLEKMSVSVEWMEDNSIKGKEVRMENTSLSSATGVEQQATAH